LGKHITKGIKADLRAMGIKGIPLFPIRYMKIKYISLDFS